MRLKRDGVEMRGKRFKLHSGAMLLATRRGKLWLSQPERDGQVYRRVATYWHYLLGKYGPALPEGES